MSNLTSSHNQIAILLLVLIAASLAGCSTPVPTDLSPIKILYTGDIDGYIDPCG
jgi:hypothetical protein